VQQKTTPEMRCLRLSGAAVSNEEVRLPRWLPFAAVLWALPAVAALNVPIRVVESAGVARKAAPVSGGVPLPRGALRDPHGVWLADPDGRPTTVQTQALERWPDGSVRWLLLDFRADVDRDGERTFSLRQGAASKAAAGPAIKASDRDGARTFDTGPVQIAVPSNGAALLDGVRAGATPLLGRVALPARDVGTVEAPAPADVTVETAGPIRTELLLRGRYPSNVTYEARVAVFAGQPVVRLQLTVTSMSDSAYVPIKALALTLSEKLAGAVVGIDGAPKKFDALGKPHLFLQRDAADGLLDGDPSGRGDGWVRATTADAALTVVSRWFWQEYPKGIRLAADALTVDLIAGGDRPVELGRGAAKTIEAWIVVQPRDAATDPPALASALRTPLVAQPPATWIVSTKALANSLDPSANGAAPFLQRVSAGYRRYEARGRAERWDDGAPVPCAQRTSEHPRVGFYGLFNWGDWNFPGYRDDTKGCDAWGNLEYDMTQVLGLAWAATGEPALREGFVVAARHFRDVDTIHHDTDNPDRVGLPHPHKVGHFAPDADRNVDLGHTWLEGLITHYRLTGEVRSLEAAKAMGDALEKRVGKASNPRHFGWPMIALGALAEATNEPAYKTAAASFSSAARGAWEPTPAAADWKIGILADGLSYVHAVTGDPALKDWLVKYANAFVAEHQRFTDARYALPLGYLSVVTGDKRYADVALEVARGIDVGDWGKQLALTGRTGFRLLGPLAAQKTAAPTPDRAGPPPASAPARRRR
jgi:hypothetical protein